MDKLKKAGLFTGSWFGCAALAFLPLIIITPLFMVTRYNIGSRDLYGLYGNWGISGSFDTLVVITDFAGLLLIPAWIFAGYLFGRTGLSMRAAVLTAHSAGFAFGLYMRLYWIVTYAAGRAGEAADAVYRYAIAYFYPLWAFTRLAGLGWRYGGGQADHARAETFTMRELFHVPDVLSAGTIVQPVLSLLFMIFLFRIGYKVALQGIEKRRAALEESV